MYTIPAVLATIENAQILAEAFGTGSGSKA
jgi:hypothetical protein